MCYKIFFHNYFMIRQATDHDISAIAEINRQSFSGNKPPAIAEAWAQSHRGQGNQYQYFVAEEDGQIVGYIGWEIKGGFAREVPVIELEQLAVHPAHRGRGTGKALVEESFQAMKARIKKWQPEVRKMRVFVWTKKDNEKAQKIYRTICKEGIMGDRDIYGTSEVMLRGTYEL